MSIYRRRIPSRFFFYHYYYYQTHQLFNPFAAHLPIVILIIILYVIYTWERNKRDRYNKPATMMVTATSTIQGYKNLLLSGTNLYGWQHITYCTLRVYINDFNKIDKQIPKDIMNYDESTVFNCYDNNIL